ncbi:MAG: YsnF/AvaK domain-containing protein [Pirellulales bacterium]|nr:YsnF/AvaK domain-containing protein [Pirellulales bacterium]
MATTRTPKTPGTVVGVFTDHDNARKATRALRDAGFTENQIGVASSNRHKTDRGATSDDDDGNYIGEGAMAGAATGAGIGALWGLGILAGVLPAIGPAIAGGTLAVLLSSAAAGAAAAGLAGALIGMGLSEEEAEFYEGEMKAGRTIVTVNAGDRRDDALRLMRQFGGYDATRDKARTDAQSTGDHALGKDCDLASGNTVQAREEKLRVQKTPVEKGEVRVRKEVHEEHKTIDVPVTREEVVIERHPASGQQVSGRDMGAGQEVRIPVREEQVNVEKQVVVAEEVSIGKRRVQDTKHIDETLRKEEIKVDTKGDVDVRDRRS